MSTQANNRRRARAITVIGEGMVAWMAAIAIRRALPDTAVVVVPGQRPGDALSDRFARVLPSAIPVLDRLGFGEAQMVRQGVAIHCIGDVLEGWGASPFVVPFDEPEVRCQGVPLRLLAQALDVQIEPRDLSPACASIATGHFDPDAGDRPGATGYALSLHPGRMLERLIAAGAALGIAHAPSRLAAVDRYGFRITALHLADGQTLSADQYIDADGVTAQSSLQPRVDWSASLPGDTMFHWRTTEAPVLASRYRTSDTGWTGKWPVPGATDCLAVFEADQAAPEVPQDARRIAVQRGRLPSPMAGNVTVIGEAAIAPGALGGLALTLAMRQIDLLLELLPDAEPQATLADAYNDRVAQLADEAQTYLAALHSLAAATGPFWRRAHAASHPATLAALLAGYRHRGHIAKRDADLIEDSNWVALLRGLGIAPALPDPIALSIPHEAANAVIARQQAAVAAIGRSMPSYSDWLHRQRRSQG